MAQGLRFVCGHCRCQVEAWSDGNPYYLDETGAKRYVHHPAADEEMERCIGNDSAHLCLECGAEFEVDSRAPLTACPACGAGEFVDAYELEALRCPYCKAGEFAVDPDFRCVS